MMAAKRDPIYPVDRYRIRLAISSKGLSVSEVAALARCDRSMIYKILSGALEGSTKLRRIYDALGLDLALMNRHDPDFESVIGDLYAVKGVFPETAARFTKEIAQQAASARAFREEQNKLEDKRREIIRAAERKDAVSSGR